MRRALAIAAVVLLAASSTAQASTPPSSPPTHGQRAMQASLIEDALKSLAKTWAKRAAKRFGRTAKEAAISYVASDFTTCNFPLPKKFCRVDDTPSWGLGMAVSSFSGSRAGVWSQPRLPAREVAQPLVPGVVYWLTCYTFGQRLSGPLGVSDLWYHMNPVGWVSDTWLGTGTNDVFPGVEHC
jgi:hypothetical protein